MGPNSDLSHLLTQHNYYLTQALLLTVESLPPSDHCVRVTTFDSAFYIILLWQSLFFSNKDFFFLFKQCPSSATVWCFTILCNCLCKEQSIKPTLLLQIFVPILHSSYSRSQRISSPPHLGWSFQQTTAPSSTLLLLFWAWASSLKWLPTVSQMEKFWIGSLGSGRYVWRRNQKNAWHRSKHLWSSLTSKQPLGQNPNFNC